MYSGPRKKPENPLLLTCNLSYPLMKANIQLFLAMMKVVPGFAYFSLFFYTSLVSFAIHYRVYYMLPQSTLIRNVIKLKGTAKLTSQGEPVCLKDSKYILFEILKLFSVKDGKYLNINFLLYAKLNKSLRVRPKFELQTLR